MEGASFNTSTGALAFLVALLFGYGFFKLLNKKRMFQKERQIFE